MANTEPQVLVTGATGTVGRELVLALRRLQGPVREARMQNLQTAYRDIRTTTASGCPPATADLLHRHP